MPQIVNCPDCGRKLRIPDTMLGKKVQCPSCCVKFKAIRVGDEPPEELEELEELEEVPEEAPRSTARRSGGRDERIGSRPKRSSRRDDDEDDRPRSRRRRYEDDDEDYPRSRRRRDDDDEEDEDDVEDERRGWKKVRYGIQLVAIGIWVWIIGTFVGGIILLLAVVLGAHALTSVDSASPGSSVTSLGLAAVAMIAGLGIMAFGNFIEMILRAVGYGLCMATPNKRGTGLRPLAITAFVLVALDFVCTLGRTAFNGLGSMAGMYGSLAGNRAGTQAGGLLGLALLLTGVASFVVFLFFLRSVCRHVRERRLGGQMITALIVFFCYYLISGVILVVLVIATFGSTFFALSSGPQQGRLGSAADTLGTMGVIAVLVFCMIVLGNLGLHIWYISLLQKVRASIEGHRRDLLD